MLNRTTVSLNQDYLDFLKILSFKRRRSLSQLLNEAVRFYLIKIEEESGVNELFFNQLEDLKGKLKLNKKDLKSYIGQGRI